MPVEADAGGASTMSQGLVPRAIGNVRQLPVYSGRTPARTTNGRFRRRLPFSRQTWPAADSLMLPRLWLGSDNSCPSLRIRRPATNDRTRRYIDTDRGEMFAGRTVGRRCSTAAV